MYAMLMTLLLFGSCVDISGHASGNNKTNLKFNIKATITEQIAGPLYKFFKRIEPFNCTNATLCADLVPYKAWHVIQEMQPISSVEDLAFPSEFNCTPIKYALFDYLVEIYDSKGIYVSSNTWEYLLENHDKINKWAFPLWSILTIVGMITATLATILIILLKSRLHIHTKIIVPPIKPPNIVHLRLSKPKY